MMNHLISIDPGLCTSGTGIAYFYKGVLKKTFYVPSDREATFKKRAENIIDTIMVNLSIQWPLADIVFEQTYFQHGGMANVWHLKICGVLDYMFGINKIAPLTVKKQLTGLGRVTWPDDLGWSKAQKKRAEKDRIKDAVLERCADRIAFKEEDVVDAVAIGLAWLEMTNG